GRVPGSPRVPAARDRPAGRRLAPGLRDVRAGPPGGRVRPGRRARRDRADRRPGPPLGQAVPAEAAAAVRVRVHLLRASGHDALGPERLPRPEGARPPPGRGASGRRRHRRAGSRLRGGRGARIRRAFGDPVRARPHPEPLRRAHVHRAAAGHPPFRGPGEAQPDTGDDRRPPGRGGRRLDRPGHHEPEDRQDDPLGRRPRGPRADLLAADPVAVLLRDRYPDPQGADRGQPPGGGDPALPGRRHARVSLARGHAEGSRRGRRPVLPRLLQRWLRGRVPARGHRAARPVRRRVSHRPGAPRRAGVQRLTYRLSGVDLAAGDAAVRRLAPWARATYRPEVLGDIGGFGGFFRIPPAYRQPVLVAGTDGVGSKLRVAFLAGRHDTVGIDLVAMSVNDVLVHGAEPLVFLDYIGIGRVEPRIVAAVVRGVAAGCRQAG